MASSSSTAQPTATNSSTRAVETVKLWFFHVWAAAQLALAQIRPLKEMVDWTAFGIPHDFADASARIRKNVTYFRLNYLIILLLPVAFRLIRHPVALLILAAILVSWGYVYMVRRDPLVLWGRVFSSLVVVTAFLILALGIGSLVIFAIVLVGLVVAVHGAFRDPNDLFLDDQGATGDYRSVVNEGGTALL